MKGVVWSPTSSDIERLEGIANERTRRQGDRVGRFRWGDQAGRHRAGVYGEAAAARVLGHHQWWPTGDPWTEKGDLPGGVEVRVGRGASYGLPVARQDRPDAPYILVVPAPNGWRVAGWAYGRDVMVPRYWRSDLPYPCWLMPQGDLHPLEELMQPSLFGEPA